MTPLARIRFSLQWFWSLLPSTFVFGGEMEDLHRRGTWNAESWQASSPEGVLSACRVPECTVVLPFLLSLLWKGISHLFVLTSFHLLRRSFLPKTCFLLLCWWSRSRASLIVVIFDDRCSPSSSTICYSFLHVLWHFPVAFRHLSLALTCQRHSWWCGERNQSNILEQPNGDDRKFQIFEHICFRFHSLVLFFPHSLSLFFFRLSSFLLFFRTRLSGDGTGLSLTLLFLPLMISHPYCVLY